MNYDPAVKVASSWKIAGCACGYTHIILLDEIGEVFAVADAPPDVARMAAAALLGAATFVEEHTEAASCH